MKHMFLKSVAVLFFSVTILATSCKKGDTGAQGEQGEQGETGATGATGATGTANVIYSDWLDVDYYEYDDTTIIGYIETDKLTDSILNYGAVYVYWNFSTASEPSIVSLPFTDTYGFFTGIKGWSLTTLYQTGMIYMLSNMDLNPGSGTNSSGDAVGQYRYVLVPGGKAARSAIDWKDYKQVQKYLGLKD